MAVTAVAAVTAGCAPASGAAAQAPSAPAAAASPAVSPGGSAGSAASGSGASAPGRSGAAGGSGAAAPALPDGYDASRNAAADISAALAAAARDHREVLIDFGANWCPDCRALQAMFRSPQVGPLLRKDYRVVAVDVGEFNLNLGLTARYVNLQTSGIPALVVLAPGGAVRTATNDGSFANARTMSPDQVRAFLLRWAPARGA